MYLILCENFYNFKKEIYLKDFMRIRRECVKMQITWIQKTENYM